MSRMGELVRWGLLPLALGAVVAFFLQAPSEPTRTDPPKVAVSRLPVASQLAPSPAPQERAAAARETESTECEALEQRLATVDGLVRRWFGDGDPWPDASVPQLDEQAFTAWMEQFASGFPDTSVVEVDCSRYPCIGVWRVEELDVRAFRERGEAFDDLRVSMRMLPIPDGEQGPTTHWMIGTSAYASGSADHGMVSLRTNAALSANGWFGYESVDPEDPEAAIPFVEEL